MPNQKKIPEKTMHHVLSLKGQVIAVFMVIFTYFLSCAKYFSSLETTWLCTNQQGKLHVTMGVARGVLGCP